MLKNYLRIAWRNMQKHKLYAIINILGLSIGLACFIFIGMYVLDEWSYDRYHAKADRIYRLWQTIELEGQGERSSSIQFPVAPNLQSEYPHLIQAAVRFFDMQQEEHLLSVDDKRFNFADIFFVDTNVLEVFDWPLLAGDPTTALSGPNQVIISPALGQSLFGDEDPIGKQIMLESTVPLLVTGLLAPIPDQTHMRVNALISFPTLRAFMGNPVQANNWVWNPCWTYLLMNEGASTQELKDQFPHFVEKFYPPFMAKQVNFFLMPLQSIHLQSQLEYEIQPNGNERTVNVLALIGLFILLIACINYVNLATARSAQRAREVGIRKVLGGQKRQLIVQFIGESVLFVCIALLISLVVVELLTPYFNALADKSFGHFKLYNSQWFPALLATSLCIGVISGLYPAFYISSFEPVKSLKSGYAAASGSKLFRNGLMVIQFAVALGLLVATLVVNRQFNYLMNTERGFVEEGVIIIRNKPAIVQQFETWRNELLRDRQIKHVTRMNEVVGVDHNVHEYRYSEMPNDEWKYFPSLIVDEYFVETFDLKLIAGRSFDPNIKSDDTAAVLVNETMIKQLNWTAAEAIGQLFITPHGQEKIIGVLQDFHFVDFTDEIQPFVLDMQRRGNFGNFFNKYTAVRIEGSAAGALQHMENVWNKLAPNFPFEYFFLDNRMQQQYNAQLILKNLVLLFSILTLIISCIGLFALSSFTAHRKTKETGIRKILGAPTYSLGFTLFKDQILLLILATLLAAPLSYFLLQRWLFSFAYRINFPLWVIPVAILLVAIISFFTISYHAIKVMKSSPINSLRVE